MLTSLYRQILKVPEVKHISYNKDTCAQPDIHALSSKAFGICHIRESTRALVITIT